MADKRRRTLPGRYGTHPIVLCLQPSTPTLTASNTTRFKVPTLRRKAYFAGFSASATQIPVSASGTLLARVVKYDASADGEVVISENIDLEALVTREGAFAGPLSTATDAQLFLDTGDTIEVHVVSNAAIGTQPTELNFTVEMLLLE